MAMKTPVTFLQEFCMKHNTIMPFYEEVRNEEDKMFTIRVKAFEATAEGSARSKQEAKHIAAGNLLMILGQDIESLRVATVEKISRAEQDYVGTLLDICIRRNIPIAKFECISSCGPSHAPSFTFKCEMSQISKTATHSTKKGAKQLVAKAMLDLVQEMFPDDQKILVPLDEAMQSDQERTDQIFKSYREWKNSDSKILPGVKLADRHNFFVNLPPETYARAMNVMAMQETDQEKVHLLADALGYKLNVSRELGENGELVVLELACDFETVHFGYVQHIYRDFLSYMKIMLNLNSLD
uniref:Putative staufen n=1 Tax=Phlebotomus kandelakii TaxID=1109342 RepID=A0A6B2EGQ0_9DIPT